MLEKRLHEGWEFTRAGESNWQPAMVPGCVHLDLLASGQIPDPFYRENEKELQWIGKTDWEYRLTFTLDREFRNKKHHELVFDGLDTYASVYLNGRKILEADNMFRQWVVEVSELLKEENTLQVCFRSPINEILPRLKEEKIVYPSTADPGEGTSPYTRKAPYHYGWDWGPRLVTSGIWRPVTLRAWDEIVLRDCYVRQRALNDRQAELEARLEVDLEEAVTLQLRLFVNDRLVKEREIRPERPGRNVLVEDLVLAAPRRWWPAGYGEPYLYSVRVELAGARATVSTTRRIGLRTLEIRREKETGRKGESFTVVVNGVPIFAKGANWIPADSFTPRVTPERYRYLLQSAVDAHMNMLRVWGGGIYEEDVFYDLCDELGLLVWQDFMFSCALYPADRSFLESVREEALYQVRRLRQHPCLALWCGNNEIEWGWYDWGWKEKYPVKFWKEYRRLFHELLPQICASEDPERLYWPSSPASDVPGKIYPNHPDYGDIHYWGVWHGREPFENYQRQRPRFASEYGFQSFPDLKTVKMFSEPADWDIFSPVMLAHQRNESGNAIIKSYLEQRYPPPKDFPAFLLLSQLLQAEGVKMGAEHFRRLRPYCMGSLYWQLNDCWPVASWSSIDYYGRWKALHYYARRFYAPLLVSPYQEDGKIRVAVVSDFPEARSAELVISLRDFHGKILKTDFRSVNIPSFSSTVFWEISREEWLEALSPDSVFLLAELRDGNKLLSENTLFFVPEKEQKLPAVRIRTRVKAGEKGLRIELWSDRLARSVYLTTGQEAGVFSDNFFHLLPDRRVTVYFQPRQPLTPEALAADLRVYSLVDWFATRR